MKPLEHLQAEDVMSSPVVTLNVETLLEEAARTLSELQISGALVTDHRGAPAGVISLFDIVTFLSGNARPTGEPGGFYRYSYPTFGEGEESEPTEGGELVEESPEELTVGELMTTEIISVAPHLPLLDVAKLMAERHIHRVFVAAEHGPAGVISTMDVLGALSGAKRAAVRT